MRLKDRPPPDFKIVISLREGGLLKNTQKDTYSGKENVPPDKSNEHSSCRNTYCFEIGEGKVTVKTQNDDENENARIGAEAGPDPVCYAGTVAVTGPLTVAADVPSRQKRIEHPSEPTQRIGEEHISLAAKLQTLLVVSVCVSLAPEYADKGEPPEERYTTSPNFAPPDIKIEFSLREEGCLKVPRKDTYWVKKNVPPDISPKHTYCKDGTISYMSKHCAPQRGIRRSMNRHPPDECRKKTP